MEPTLDTSMLRLASLVAAVLIFGIAASVARVAVRSDNNRWWLSILGIVFALVLVFAGYKVSRNVTYNPFAY